MADHKKPRYKILRNPNGKYMAEGGEWTWININGSSCDTYEETEKMAKAWVERAQTTQWSKPTKAQILQDKLKDDSSKKEPTKEVHDSGPC